MSTAQPRFRALSREECEAILARNQLGRLAYGHQRRVEIEPLHYVYSAGWIYGRTSAGDKLEATAETWAPVAFEVDEAEGLFQWRSVVVHGGFYAMSPGEEGDSWREGVDLLRRLVPETFHADDPVPFRTVIFRIGVVEITGREAVPG